jgi:trimethylamine--corrinoid protein Co-methyltransferase
LLQIKENREIKMQTNTTVKATPFFRMLTCDQILELTKAAMEILEKVGFRLLHADAKKLFKQAGAIVTDNTVKVPEFIVRKCIDTTPKGWTIFNREGKRALEVQGRNSYYGTSTGSPITKDALTGEFHETKLEDLRLSAIIADAMENIDWVMPMGSAQDVPAMAADLHEFVETVSNTVKPIVFLTYSPQGTEIIYDMAAEIAGGQEKLREKPFLVLYPEPISPLVLPEDVVDRMFIAADRFLPQMAGPAIQFGATGPVTMAGAVAQGLAESLMCLVTAQLRNPGCPIGLGCNFGAFDMKRGLMSDGAPEMSIALAAQAEVAQYFGLPTWGLAGATDSKILDAQAGAEAAFHILAQGQAGLNLIHDVGYMDSSMACAAEQLVLGNEIIGMAKRFLEGFEINTEQLAKDVIAEVGPGGQYLSHRHTFTNFRKELWQTTIFTRQNREAWIQDGSKDTETRIRERILEIKETHKVETLADSLLQKLEEMKNEGQKRLTSK